MKKKFITLFTFIFIALIILLIYKLYPKNGSFNDLVLSKYPNTQFEDLIIGKKGGSKICTDVNKINEFLAYLKKVQISEYRGKIPYGTGDIYLIGIYSNSNKFLGITIQNKNFIQIDINTDGHNYVSKKYKIKNNSLDIEYIKNFFNDF